MSESSSERPRVIPMLAYEDGVAALEWLAQAFGFNETMRFLNPDGSVGQADMEVNGGRIMLATPTPDYQVSPPSRRDLRGSTPLADGAVDYRRCLGAGEGLGRALRAGEGRRCAHSIGAGEPGLRCPFVSG